MARTSCIASIKPQAYLLANFDDHRRKRRNIAATRHISVTYSGGKTSMAESIRRSAADNNYEYGFMYGRTFGGGHGVGDVYTSGNPNAIDPGLAELR